MSNRLERILAMDEEIRKGTYPNVPRFCEMFEVKKRTVLDDIKLMKERLGLAIEYDHFNRGYFNSNPKKQLPAFQLTEGEIFALTLGKEMLSQYTGTSFEPILISALDKIRERLPDQIDMSFDDVRSIVRFNAGPVIPISRKLFLDLNKACDDGVEVELEYYSASKDEVTERAVEPYRLMEYRSTWYLVAYCLMRKSMRIFALHRIREQRVTHKVFTPRPAEQIDQWLDRAFQLEHGSSEFRVSIRFSPTAARYVRERQWHHSQELQENPDHGCTLSFTSQSLDETKRWVLAYGMEAEVLAPAELRTMIEREIEGMTALYGTASPIISRS